MNNKILFEDDNTNGNAELLKENTPQTIDYNKLYNIQEKQQNNLQEINNIENKNNIDSNINIENVNSENQISKENSSNNKNEFNSLLLVFLIFLIIMGAILFLFPFLRNLTAQ